MAMRATQELFSHGHRVGIFVVQLRHGGGVIFAQQILIVVCGRVDVPREFCPSSAEDGSETLAA
jgi:hypothetical protein